MHRVRPYPSLKVWRTALHLSQEEAAQMLGITQAHYSRLERQTRRLRPRKAQAASELTGVPLEVLLGIAS